MKILFWMNTNFHTTSRHILISIIRELCLAGHSVIVMQKEIVGDNEILPQELDDLDVDSRVIRVNKPSKYNLAARFITDIKYIIKSKSKIDRDIDAVFVQSSNVAGLCAYYKRILVPNALMTLNVQDIFPYNAVYSGKIKKGGIIFKVLSSFQRYAYKSSDNIITISPDMKKLLEDDGVNSNKITVIYNWSYQDDVYDHLSLRNVKVSKMLSSDYFNVVYAGNIGVMQNADIIIESARILAPYKDIHFHIIGDGVYKERLINRVKQYRLNNVSFWPFQESELAPAIYCTADINIVPLGKEIYKTALPSKTATCLACQKPIIFAIGRDSEFGKFINEITGCPVVDSDDVKAFSEAVLLIKEGKIKCKTKDAFVEHFSKTMNSKHYVEIITKR